MKLTLKAKKKGKFILAPKIQFIDENGKSKTFELEQIAVTVKELGIRGWLKGSG
jgi:phage antirepressor YoqD-like protein